MRDPRYIVDAGPIVAALNRRDLYHEWAKSAEPRGQPADRCGLREKGRGRRTEYSGGRSLGAGRFNRSKIVARHPMDAPDSFASRFKPVRIRITPAALDPGRQVLTSRSIHGVRPLIAALRRRGRRRRESNSPDQCRWTDVRSCAHRKLLYRCWLCPPFCEFSVGASSFTRTKATNRFMSTARRPRRNANSGWMSRPLTSAKNLP